MSQPFKINVSDESLELLAKKLALTRLPDEIEDAGWDYGVPLQDIRRLVGRWKDGFDWRKQEKMLNDELPQFTRDIEVDGFGKLNVHFVHQESKTKNAIPLLFAHGWPGSFLEVRKILPLLTTGYPSFHVVAIGHPGYGFSEAPKKKGFGLAQYAEVGHKLMLALGYKDDPGSAESDSGDWGFGITRTLAAKYGPEYSKAWHTNTQYYTGPKPDYDSPAHQALTPSEQAGLQRTKWFEEKGCGYYAEQSTQPQTLGYSLSDSPVGLLAWIYEKLVNWTDNYDWDDDEVLTWISVYWFSGSGPAASIRIYYEYEQGGGRASLLNPTIPFGKSYFPKEIYVLPKAWMTEKNLIFESYHQSGGHFAAHEKPGELIDDLRRMFGKGGPAYGVVPGKDGYN
ncbi:epoxide hydrolase [Moniliophthora roreri]|nr:epoxide hydrolase [Moniliophthora roreri]